MRKSSYSTRPRVHFLALLSIFAKVLPHTEAVLPANGLCSLFTFVPFSYGSESFDSFYCGDCNNIGFSHTAAAIMAIEDFNARNTRIVPQLDEFRDCPVQFDLNNSRIFDTQTITHQAAKSLLAQPEPPCAVAGPFHDAPFLELSTLAAAMEFPITAHRAFSIRALANYSSPYSSQVFPDVIASAQVLAIYLLYYKARTDYVAFVYSLTETGLQRRETVAIVLDEFEITNQAFSYNSPLKSPADSDARTPLKTMQRVKDSGYRTIVIAPEDPTSEIPLLAEAAVEVGLTNGEYFFIWFGDFDPFFGSAREGSAIREFLKGSIFMTPFEGHHLGWQDPFYVAWKSQGKPEVDRLNGINPILPGEPGYFFAEDDYFTKADPEWGSSFLYDAIMATGMGACLAMKENVDETSDVSVDTFVRGIRSVDFTGATGVVSFCEPEYCDLEGARKHDGAIWGFLNNYPPGANMTECKCEDDICECEENPWRPADLFYYPAVTTDFIFRNESSLYGLVPRPDLGPSFPNGSGYFLEVFGTIYADGRAVPPDLLRDEPEQNYLSRGLQIFGFILLGIAWLLATVSAIWVYTYRKHRIVKAAQPYFLYVICLGASVSVSGILMISFDESNGCTEEQLGRACMATPWLACLGHIITYGALFSKLWRINRVLQFVRRKVDIAHVAWPSAILVAMALLVLALWTGLDPLRWNRHEINIITGESIGECSSENSAAFIAPLAVIVMIPTLLTFYMALKTKDIDDAFSESRWIFVMVLIQLEVLLFAAPLIPLLRDVSTDGRYVGYALIIWVFPMSALGLIIGPKMYAVHRKVDHLASTRGSVGIAGRVRVSGGESSTTNSGPARTRLPDSIASEILAEGVSKAAAGLSEEKSATLSSSGEQVPMGSNDSAGSETHLSEEDHSGTSDEKTSSPTLATEQSAKGATAFEQKRDEQ